MKKIKRLEVKVTYSVGLGGIKVSDDLFCQLDKMCEKQQDIEGLVSYEFSDACEWLRDNIKQRDCFDLSFEIAELELENL